MNKDPRIDAYLFDMDGTLAQTEPLWVPALCDMLRADGHALPIDEARSIVVGHSWNSIYADIAARFPGEAVGVDVLAARLRPYYLRLRDTSDIRIPGSCDMVRAVSSHTRCAVVSGSCRIDVEETLDILGIRDAFTLLLGAEDVPRGKPDPMGFLLAAERLGVEPGRCVVVEDSAAGVRAGKAAGMRVVALTLTGVAPQDVRHHADICVASLVDYSPAALFGGASVS